jgi:hypothetical protein
MRGKGVIGAACHQPAEARPAITAPNAKINMKIAKRV